MSSFVWLASVLLLATCISAAEPSHVHRLKSLAEECAFKLGETSFDLCPLFSGEGAWTVEFERRTPPSVTKTSYKMNLKAPLEEDTSLPNHEQCPRGTFICQTISIRRPLHKDETSWITQVISVAGAMNLPNVTRYYPGLNTTVQVTPTRDNANVNILYARLHGGYYMSIPQKADIQFMCDSSVVEPSLPSYSRTWNGTHTFQWRTKHACGSRQAKPPAEEDGDTAPTEDDPIPPPDDEDADTGEQDLAGGQPLSGRMKHSTTLLLFSSITAIITLSWLALHPPMRFRRYVTRLIKSHPRWRRFRVGESVLVRWAYEDLELEQDFVIGGGEEDTMVNFAPEEEVGEGIPLKPSPRRGPWTNYGTASVTLK